MKPSKKFRKFCSKYNGGKDYIKKLFIPSLIDSCSRVEKIRNISEYTEPNIRNEFQYDLIYRNILTKNLIKDNLITLGCENQIINKEKEIMRTDIQFVINGIINYVIECKKLENANKSQYIDKGLSRFIENRYIGANEKYAGMCSFIVGGVKISDIIENIQKKIIEYNFKRIIKKNICNLKYSFSSLHSKIDENDIFIHHLFFKLK